MKKEMIPTEGKLAAFIEQLQPNVVVRPITTNSGVHKVLSSKSFTVLELTAKGYTSQFEKGTSVLFTFYPTEEQILCISRKFVTTRQDGVIATWEFIYPTGE